MHIRKSSKNLKLSLIQILCLSCQFGFFSFHIDDISIFSTFKKIQDREKEWPIEKEERESARGKEREGGNGWMKKSPKISI